MSERLLDSSNNNSHPRSGYAKSISRILREYYDIEKEPSNYWSAYPLDLEDPYEWHFTIRGPDKSDFENGLYHGRIILPENYPFSPPSVILLTPNGRFEVGKKVCLNASNYHPELWQPSWGLRVMLAALCAFFPTPGEGAIHSLDWTPELRLQLAKESVNWTCAICKKSNKELLNKSDLNSTLKLDDTTNSFEVQRSLITNQNGDISTNQNNNNVNTNDNVRDHERDAQDLIDARNRRLRPHQTQTSILNYIFSKPSNKMEILLLFLDTCLAILIISLVIFFADLLVEIINVF